MDAKEGTRQGQLIQVEPIRDLSDPKKRYAFLLQAFFSGRNPNTLRNYSKALKDFAGFIGAPTGERAVERLFGGPPGEANAIALAYRDELVRRKLAPNTINVRLAALRTVGKLARMLGLVPWELEVGSLKVQVYRDTSGPGKEAVLKVLRELDQKTDRISIRDRAIIRLIYENALRRKEVCGLDLGDYVPEKDGLWILGKGRLERELITLAPKAKLALEAWIAVRGRDPGPLFINFDPTGKGDKRLSGMSVWRIVRKYGLGWPHAIRHTAITEALDKTGGDVRKVQKFSRHKKTETLMMYDDNRRDFAGEISRMLDEET